MAIDFEDGNTANYMRTSNTAAGALPNTAWTLGVWIGPVAALSGTSSRHWFSTQSGAGANWSFFTNESGGNAGRPLVVVNDGVTSEAVPINGYSIVSANPILLVASHSGANGTVKLRAITIGSGSLDGTGTSVATFGAVATPNNVHIGNRADLADRWWEDPLGDAFIVSDADLSDAEVIALANGTSALDLGHTMQGYWPLHTPDDLRDLSGNGYTLTKFGDAPYSPVAYIEKRWQRYAAGSN